MSGEGRPSTFVYSSPDLTAAQKAKERAAFYRSADYKKPEKKKAEVVKEEPEVVESEDAELHKALVKEGKTSAEADAILEKVRKTLKQGKVKAFLKKSARKFKVGKLNEREKAYAYSEEFLKTTFPNKEALDIAQGLTNIHWNLTGTIKGDKALNEKQFLSKKFKDIYDDFAKEKDESGRKRLLHEYKKTQYIFTPQKLTSNGSPMKEKRAGRNGQMMLFLLGYVKNNYSGSQQFVTIHPNGEIHGPGDYYANTRHLGMYDFKNKRLTEWNQFPVPH